MINEEEVKNILEETKGRIIVAATKYGDDSDILKLVSLGINHIGENRVKVFLDKYELLHDADIVWHFIGHLQSKKVKMMINKIDYLHSLDRMSLVEQIQQHRSLPLPCFLEVNISKEASKYGLPSEEVVSFYKKIQNYDKINVVGLMGMATHTDDMAIIREQFGKLQEIKNEINSFTDKPIEYLSIGMSNDYKIALEFEATHLRIGSILFRKEE
jgi:PLP dependent protein